MRRKLNYTLVFLLAFAAIVGLFSEPDAQLSNAHWFAVFAVTKAAGLAAGYAAYRLLARMEKRGEIQAREED